MVSCILMPTLFSCSSDDESSDRIEGFWYQPYSTPESPSGYEFKGNGTGYHFYGSYMDPLTWSFNGDCLVATISDDTNNFWNLNHEVIGIKKDKMVLKSNKFGTFSTFYRSSNGEGNHEDQEDPSGTRKAPSSLTGLTIGLSQKNSSGLSLGYDKFTFITSTDFTCDFASGLGTYSYRRNSDTSANLTLTIDQLWGTFTRHITYTLKLVFEPSSTEDWDFTGSGTKVFKGGLDAGSWTITVKGYYE